MLLDLLDGDNSFFEGVEVLLHAVQTIIVTLDGYIYISQKMSLQFGNIKLILIIFSILSLILIFLHLFFILVILVLLFSPLVLATLL